MLLTYFNSDKPTAPNIDEISEYFNILHKYKETTNFKEMRTDINSLSSENFNDFVNKHESKISQSILIPLEFESLVKLKDIANNKGHYLEEAVDETIKYKTHILKNLNSYAQKSSNFGINGFIMKKKFEDNGFEIKKNKDLKMFSKNNFDAFSYDKIKKEINTEGACIRDLDGSTRIEFRNGNLNVRNDLKTIEYHLNERPSRKMRP